MTKKQKQLEVFSFGDAETVLDRREYWSYAEVWHNGRYYEPKYSRLKLAQLLRAVPAHHSAILAKVNLLVRDFEPTPNLSRLEFRKWANDFLIFGDGFIERINNIAGRPLRLESAFAFSVRRGLKDGQYFSVDGIGKEHEFSNGSIFHLMEFDVTQEIYGAPAYLAALQSILLNENATLFRRRYYINGAHAGFILYLSGEEFDDEDITSLRERLKESKGVGNFKNLFLHSRGGKEGDVKLVPISEVAAKDEFLNVKNVTRDDVLTVHRWPPQLLGIVPNNAGGFGDVVSASNAAFQNEIIPLQMRFLELNDWLGVEAVKFKPFEPMAREGNKKPTSE